MPDGEPPADPPLALAIDVDVNEAEDAPAEGAAHVRNMLSFVSAEIRRSTRRPAQFGNDGT